MIADKYLTKLPRKETGATMSDINGHGNIIDDELELDEMNDASCVHLPPAIVAALADGQEVHELPDDYKFGVFNPITHPVTRSGMPVATDLVLSA